jgi:hypothetical protein
MEDRRNHYEMMIAVAPLSRTPMDRRSGDAINKYSKELSRALEDLTPWLSKASALRATYGRKIKPGEIVVIPDESDGSLGTNPLYKDAKVLREHGK